MRCLNKNKQIVYYKNLLTTSQSEDENGFYNGNLEPEYDSYVEIKANVSGAVNDVSIVGYGINVDYDKVLVTNDISLPITETTIFKIDNDEYRTININKTINTLKIRIKQIT